MSTLTAHWTEEKIRSIIRNLDKKTGLSGSAWLIDFDCEGHTLGMYWTHERKFSFNRQFFDDPKTKEAEVVDIIRHEYAHY